ncbi:MAG: Hsp33 family molecular chaperone HslO [Clostridia bacterium]|nr:Hsp33 family molecular chaperone HslO [Clostridia bacterium]MBQ8446918.1 Hsp33 family molecular chaperone HslO [Clostridia bacterium]
MHNLLRTLVYDGQVSLTLADTTALVAKGALTHGLSGTSAYLFGKSLSAMTFMSACLKGETGEISLSLKTSGIGGEIAVSGNRALFMRGYIENTDVQGDCNEKTERAAFAENGSLTIIRNDGYARPFVGACAFPTNGGLDEAFEEYFRISEQLPTRIATTVELSEDGAVLFAGVAVLQPLPFADEKTLQKVATVDLEKLLCNIKAQGVECAAEQSFGKDEMVWETLTAQYKCNCSRQYLTRVLVSLGEEQMRAIIKEDGAVRIHCHYCNTDYAFDGNDADELFKKHE